MNGNALHVLTEFYRTPWAVLPETLAAMTAVLHRWADGMKLSDEEIRAAVGDAPVRSVARREQEAQAGGDMIAVLPVFGIIAHRARLLREVSSGIGTSTELLGQAFRAAMKDPNIGAIVLDVDSPGGSAFGVDELAADIHAARGAGKPIVASVNSMAASAAYWIASAADEIVITPSGLAGSIGVWGAHEDWSKFLDTKGVKVTLVSSGKFKVEGHPYGPLDDTARAAMQDMADKYYGMFTKAIARNRNAESPKAVREGYGEGRVMTAKDAVSSGLADRVGTFDQVIGELQKKLAKNRSNSSAQRAADLRNLDIASRG